MICHERVMICHDTWFMMLWILDISILGVYGIGRYINDISMLDEVPKRQTLHGGNHCGLVEFFFLSLL